MNFQRYKFVLINEGESNRKLPKIFAGKNFFDKTFPSSLRNKLKTLIQNVPLFIPVWCNIF